jgi:prepilin-type N-terminal cleavage/methylation domain-containing protein
MRELLPKVPHRLAGARKPLGYTLIELVVVMMVLSILAGIAMQLYQGFVIRARATDIIGDMNAVKVAVLTYQSDHNAWPPEAGSGQIPPGLADYLPGGFSFDNEDFVLDYENWSGSGDSPFNVGVAFTTEEEPLGLWVLDIMGSSVWPGGAGRFTWVIDG